MNREPPSIDEIIEGLDSRLDELRAEGINPLNEPDPYYKVPVQEVAVIVAEFKRRKRRVSHYSARELKARIENADLTDDKTYMKVVDDVLYTLRLHEADVGNALHVSTPTVHRWRRGVTAPHELAREPIRRFAMRKIEEVLAEKEENLVG
jgi:hypothetical protein